MSIGLTDYIMDKAKYRAEKYRQSPKMLSITKECTVIEIKPAAEYGYAIEKKKFKK